MPHAVRTRDDVALAADGLYRACGPGARAGRGRLRRRARVHRGLRARAGGDLRPGPLQRVLLRHDAVVLHRRGGRVDRRLRHPGRPAAGRPRRRPGAGPGRAGRRNRRDAVRADVRRSRLRAAAAGPAGRHRPRAGGAGVHQLRRRAAGPGPPGAAARAGGRPGRRGAGPPGAVHRLGRPVARPAGTGPGGRGPGGRRTAHLRGPPPDPGAARGPPAARHPGRTRLRRRGLVDAAAQPGLGPEPARRARLRDLEQIDAWSTDWFTEQAGHSAHETRTSIAAYAALAAAGPYRVTASFYEPIPAWIAGFAVTTARPASA